MTRPWLVDLKPAEQGTRWLFGKAYHWFHRPTGQRVLSRGTVEDCDLCSPDAAGGGP